MLLPILPSTAAVPASRVLLMAQNTMTAIRDRFAECARFARSAQRPVGCGFGFKECEQAGLCSVNQKIGRCPIQTFTLLINI